MTNIELTSEQQAVNLIRDEKLAWENATVWVSDSTSFDMRKEIDNARKNYFGQFTNPIDTDTRLEKLFVPLTEWTIERMVANCDIYTKNLHLRNPYGKWTPVPIVMKMVMDNFLKKMNFGEYLNDKIRKLCIDGTGITKYFNQYNEEYKRNFPCLRIVDSLNIIIDPTVYSIQDNPIIEKAIMTRPELEKYRNNWKNFDKIQYSDNSVPCAIIYERWGKFPFSFITRNKSDINKWVEGTIIASGEPRNIEFKNVSAKANEEIIYIHSIKLNNSEIKPYEDCWLKRVPNRYFGRGIPEQLKGLQEWINAVVNMRREEMFVKLAGKYKIRKGSGITKQMIQSLRAGGAIPVEEMEDILELSERDIKPSAYREPQEIIEMAERVTGVRETPTSQAMQATTAMIQEQGVRSISNLIQQNFGLFLERLFRRGVLPLIIKNLKDGEVMKITGEPEDLELVDQSHINFNVNKMLKEYKNKYNKEPSIYEISQLRTNIERILKQQGRNRSMEIKKYVFDIDYDIDFAVTVERFDPAVILRNLNDFLISYARLPQADTNIINAVVREYLGQLEIPVTRKLDFSGEKMVAPPELQPTKPRQEMATPRTEFQRANIEGILSPKEMPV